jgi:hypothetical protein
MSSEIIQNVVSFIVYTIEKRVYLNLMTLQIFENELLDNHNMHFKFAFMAKFHINAQRTYIYNVMSF